MGRNGRADDLRERLLAVAIAVVLTAAVAAAFLVDDTGRVDAVAAGRCATHIAQDLELDRVGPAVVRPHGFEQPDGTEIEAWSVRVPLAEFVLDLHITADGMVRSVRGITASGADPLDRDHRLTARGARCRP